MTAVSCDPEDLPGSDSGPINDDGVDDQEPAAPGDPDDAGVDGGVDERDGQEVADTPERASGDTAEDEPVQPIEITLDETAVRATEVTVLVDGTWTGLTEPPAEVDARGVSILIAGDTIVRVDVDAATDSPHYALSLAVDTVEGGFLTFRCSSLADLDGETVRSQDVAYFLDGVVAEPPPPPTCTADEKYSMTLPMQCLDDDFVVRFEAGTAVLSFEVPLQVTVDSGDPDEPAIAVYELDVDLAARCE